jgi:hypothetical protein
VSYALNFLDRRRRGIGIKIRTIRRVPVYYYAYISGYAWGVGG